MKNKIFGIFICMLLISTIVFPFVNASNINTSFKKINKELISSDRPKIWVSVPDVHIYSKNPLINWAKVEFDNPGVVIDVNISNIEGDEFLLGISQKIICHVDSQKFPVMLIYSSDSSWNSIGIDSYFNWEFNATTAWLLFDKIDSYYPLNLTITGVPFILLGLIPFTLIPYIIIWEYLGISENPFPTSFEKRHGTTVQYQLHFIV